MDELTRLATDKILVIVGTTGSGKTALGIEIAKKIGGEVISADSRAIWKGADIGTAKPSLLEREGVVHHGFDLVEAGERWTVADWKSYAEDKIEDILDRGKRPIIVGGTGLYIDALIYDYQFGKPRGDESDRDKINSRFAIVGLKWTKEELRERLRQRAEKMFANPKLYEETKEIHAEYGEEALVWTSNIYPLAQAVIKGALDKTEAIDLFITKDWHLAKRQMTWFKRNPEILWLDRGKIIDKKG